MLGGEAQRLPVLAPRRARADRAGAQVAARRLASLGRAGSSRRARSADEEGVEDDAGYRAEDALRTDVLRLLRDVARRVPALVAPVLRHRDTARQRCPLVIVEEAADRGCAEEGDQRRRDGDDDERGDEPAAEGVALEDENGRDGRDPAEREEEAEDGEPARVTLGRDDVNELNELSQAEAEADEEYEGADPRDEHRVSLRRDEIRAGPRRDHLGGAASALPRARSENSFRRCAYGRRAANSGVRLRTETKTSSRSCRTVGWGFWIKTLNVLPPWSAGVETGGAGGMKSVRSRTSLGAQ